ncbi:hypothetical protein [Streptomyces sp. HD]|uniref:hypothetical protein n=1 Tax=Streptomyces sp. HD TaxID=3020892 RepID=UPI00232B5682|nr:hypothetical protein [Streptomyces sp. HD]MDC0765456.1 hypothetical protein [Streptomyces sp. HD]
MADDRRNAPDPKSGPVPKDPPDQQADAGEDPWEVPVEPADGATEADDVPDTDEAGTGRKGTTRSDTVHPEHPKPQEPTG